MCIIKSCAVTCGHIFCTHLEVLDNLVLGNVGHVIEGPKVLASYMAVQCDCHRRSVGRILGMN